jgi:hypothetical protein
MRHVFHITSTGMREIREKLEEYSTIAVITAGVMDAWADKVLFSLDEGDGAHFEIGYQHSRTGSPVTFELSQEAWESHYEEDEDEGGAKGRR